MLHERSVPKAASRGPATSPVGHVTLDRDTAAEQPASESFIVRVYRIDREDGQKITGLVEALDGSGEREPFTRIDELSAILRRRVMDNLRSA